MGLTKPDVSGDVNVWGGELNSSLDQVDSHDHSPGKGVRLTPASLNINSDLDFGGNDAIDLSSVQLNNQASLTASLAIYPKGGNLFWNNNAGFPVQITDGVGLRIQAVTGSNAFAFQSLSSTSSSISAATTSSFFEVNISTNKAITLPSSSAVPLGRALYFANDRFSQTSKVTINTVGTDTLAGSSAYAMYGWCLVVAGTNGWDLIDIASVFNQTNVGKNIPITGGQTDQSTIRFQFQASNWAQSSTSSAGSVYIDLNLPSLANTLTCITASIIGGSGHGSLPSTMPKLSLVQIDVPSSETNLFSVTDPTGTILAYENPHVFYLACNQVVDPTKRYAIKFEGEAGTTSKLSVQLFKLQASYTTPGH